jgi:cytosine/adenosine deaminase-related metal-dependent hydrolase
MAKLTRHRARWVLPIARPPIAEGAILVEEAEGGAATVRDVGRERELAGGGSGAAVVDHGEAVLLPALVNAHTTSSCRCQPACRSASTTPTG